MARKRKIRRDEVEELDEAYLGLAGKAPKGKGFSSFFSLLLILLLIGGAVLLIYLLATGQFDSIGNAA